jgi:tRNA threonylcarbamoyl adenosine modification protein YeaZ
MKILAVEFSSEERSVAVASDGNVLANVTENGGRRALGLVEKALAEAGCEREEIECIAIGIGPGSYTGIRGAIALAQGWQLGRAVRLIGISSVESLAARAWAENMRGTVNVVVDAQRQEFYLARYEMDSKEYKETEPLRLVSFAEVAALSQIVGPDVAQFFPSARNLCPDAATLARLAATKEEFIAGEKLEPIYLRETSFKKSPPWRALSS